MNKEKTSSTITVLALAFLVLFILSQNKIYFAIALILLLNNLLFPRISTKIAELWMRFAELLGKVNSTILLTLVFFLFLTPIAFAYRIFNRSTVAQFKHDDRESYFDKKKEIPGKDYLLRQW